VATQLFHQGFVAVNDAVAAFDLGFGGITFSTLTDDVESRGL
jgi:hypothetical protein